MQTYLVTKNKTILNFILLAGWPGRQRPDSSRRMLIASLQSWINRLIVFICFLQGKEKRFWTQLSILVILDESVQNCTFWFGWLWETRVNPSCDICNLTFQFIRIRDDSKLMRYQVLQEHLSYGCVLPAWEPKNSRNR